MPQRLGLRPRGLEEQEEGFLEEGPRAAFQEGRRARAEVQTDGQARLNS